MDIPLTFATFYTCGIKQSTNLTQRDCINLLLKGYIGSDSSDILSDSVCSNYAKGKKNIAGDLQVELLSLTRENFIDRLNKINIQDFTVVSYALFILIKNSSLPNNEKKRLIKHYTAQNELAFIAEVFLISLKGDNCYSISQSLISILESYRYSAILARKKNNDSITYENIDWESNPIYDEQIDITANDDKSNEDFDWMRNYVPDSMIGTPPAFVHGKVKTITVALELPRDYSAIIYSLKPSLTESTYETFTIEDFAKTMNIDITRNTVILQKGKLEYWNFEGDIESVLPSLKNYNFSEVSDFAFQLIGEFTSKDVDKLKQYLKDISNYNVNILTSLIIDKEQANINLTLIVHKCAKKVIEQKLDSEHDGTHLYEPLRSTDTHRKS